MRKPRHSDVEQLSLGNTARKEQTWVSNSTAGTFTLYIINFPSDNVSLEKVERWEQRADENKQNDRWKVSGTEEEKQDSLGHQKATSPHLDQMCKYWVRKCISSLPCKWKTLQNQCRDRS